MSMRFDINKFFDDISGRTELKGKITILHEAIDYNLITIDNLQNKIVSQNDLIFQIQKSDGGKVEKIVQQASLVDSLQQTIATQQATLLDKDGAIGSLKTELAIAGEVQYAIPNFLDMAKKPFIPVLQYIHQDGKPDSVMCPDFREVYVFFEFQKAFARQWRQLSKVEKLKKIWAFVIQTMTYEGDWGDDWSPSIYPYLRKRGDCNQGTELFLATARACGIRADECYNAIGPSPFGYHSYPIVFLGSDDAQVWFNDKTRTGWYIFETTIDSVPAEPALLTATDYHIDEGGIQNWQMGGQIKPAYFKSFNALPAGPGALARKTVQHSEEKRQKINEYWKNKEWKNPKKP